MQSNDLVKVKVTICYKININFFFLKKPGNRKTLAITGTKSIGEF